MYIRESDAYLKCGRSMTRSKIRCKLMGLVSGSSATSSGTPNSNGSGSNDDNAVEVAPLADLLKLAEDDDCIVRIYLLK